MSMRQVAAEAAAFSRDALAALQKVPRVSVAITPIAPMGLTSRPCCANVSQCEHVASSAARPQCQLMASNKIALTSLSFEKLMLEAEPDLWKTVGWFSSHACEDAIRQERDRARAKGSLRSPAASQCAASSASCACLCPQA